VGIKDITPTYRTSSLGCVVMLLDAICVQLVYAHVDRQSYSCWCSGLLTMTISLVNRSGCAQNTICLSLYYFSLGMSKRFLRLHHLWRRCICYYWWLMVALCWTPCYQCDIGFTSLSMCSRIHALVQMSVIPLCTSSSRWR